MSINYGKQSIDQSDIDAVVSVLKSDWLTQGPLANKFENNLKQKFGSKHCCVVSSGTAALHLTGLALGWGPGDIIITSPITFLATANSILYCNSTPDFVDIDSNSYTIDVKKLEEKIINYESKGKKVKAIIGVDYAGHPCDWEGLNLIANKYKIQLINDNCHAMGAKFLGNSHYATKYADIVTHSYHPVKNFTTGEGGAIFTENRELDEKIRKLRNHGISKEFNKQKQDQGSWFYDIHEVGFNYRITEMQCALGISQLKKLDTFIDKRNRIAKIYNESFSNDKNLIIPNCSNRINHAYHLYPLRVKFNKVKITKKEFFEKMDKDGIKLQVHYIPIHFQPLYQKKYKFKIGDFPIAENFYDEEISIPIYPLLTDDKIQFVIERIKHNLN